MALFHLAFRVNDIVSTRRFYGDILGCPQGRETESWIDFNFFGHQISAHLGPRLTDGNDGEVDGDHVPVPHFGAVLEWDDWQALADHLVAKSIPFLLAPKIRFAAQPGEQGTFFVTDPSGNVIEFKTFRDFNSVFQAA